jgi:hypothetical protein
MISICPPEKKLADNFEVFSFKAWYHITLDLLYSEFCILFFKSNLVFAVINHDKHPIIIISKLYFFLHE